MTDRLDELLELWEEAADAGREVSAADLCKDCPHLTGELAAHRPAEGAGLAQAVAGNG